MAVGYWVAQMGADADRNIQDRQDELLQKQIDDFEASWNKQHKPGASQSWIQLRR